MLKYFRGARTYENTFGVQGITKVENRCFSYTLTFFVNFKFVPENQEFSFIKDF